MKEQKKWTRREFIRRTSSGIVLTTIGAKAFCQEENIIPSIPFQSDELSELFLHPSHEARPRCYWYWMNGNITREGILADLEGLAEIGVNGVNYFDIGLLPAGPVINRSREWQELVGYAIEEAAKRNIRVSFNCPGWSGTGGAWITPEWSMQELTWSETVVEGGRKVTTQLPQPPTRLGYYRDIAIIAFPTPAGDKPLPLPTVYDLQGNVQPQAMEALKPRVDLADHVLSQAPGVPSAEVASSEDNMSVELPATFDLVFPHAVTLRSVYVHATRKNGGFQAQVLAWDDSSATFQPVGRMNSCTAGPFSDHLASTCFPATKTTKYRLAFENAKKTTRVQLEKLSVSGGFRVANWPAKIGFANDPVSPFVKDQLLQDGDVMPIDQVVDLTDHIDTSGKITWLTPPKGSWTILRIGHTPTGVYLFPTPVGGAGLDCDKMSREAADFHYDHCVKPFLKAYGRFMTGNAMTYYHMDSYESGWQNWTAKFPEDFNSRRGYSLLRYMPALTGRVVESQETTERFLWDFRRTISDLFADNNYGRLAERCRADGIQFSTEPYGGPFEHVQVGLRADHPMTEVWIQRPVHGKKVWFQAVQSGHITGKKVIGAETFTSGPPHGGMWADHPFSLKALGDYIFCCGINQHCFHVSVHQPLTDDHLRPGFTCGQNGIHFDRGEIWWRHGGKEWVNYITRCQALLQVGEHVADVLYFQGNDAPYGVYNLEKELPDGYDFDVCGSETLDGLSVKNNRIVLPFGKSYRYLGLPGHGRITLFSLRKIVALASAGAQVVGVLPKESPSLTDAAGTEEYQKLTRKLETFIRTQSFKEQFTADRLPPDFSYDESRGMVIHTIHRELGDTDYYFVANANADVDSGKKGLVDCSFRMTGKIPELFHADTGVIKPCVTYRESDGVTTIPIHFDPSGSVFVVFRPGKTKSGDRVVSGSQVTDHHPVSEAVNTSWTLLFPAGWGAPEKIMCDKLFSWPDHPDEGIRYFSGNATYKTTLPTIQVKPDCRLILDLGRVEVIAEVWLNGFSLGTIWKPPFVCDITGMLLPKANELEVQVTNLWVNRLIGDEQYPDDCSENGQWRSGPIPSWPEWITKGLPRPESRRLTFCTWKHWRKDDPLKPSGLLGPVTLRQTKIN